MNNIKFLRNTHKNGRHRSFPPEARQFWQDSADVVGTVLRLETPLTLAEVVTECRNFTAEYPEAESYKKMNEAYVAWCLIKLVEFDMAAVVITEPEQEGWAANPARQRRMVPSALWDHAHSMKSAIDNRLYFA